MQLMRLLPQRPLNWRALMLFATVPAGCPRICCTPSKKHQPRLNSEWISSWAVRATWGQ